MATVLCRKQPEATEIFAINFRGARCARRMLETEAGRGGKRESRTEGGLPASHTISETHVRKSEMVRINIPVLAFCALS